MLGVGLIGGSIGLAARHRLGAEVIGFDPDEGDAARAAELGAIDRAASSVAAAVEGAEAIFCACPVAALPSLVAESLSLSGPDAVVTDVGSTKRALVEAVSARDDDDRFIGGHPLAGAETSGVEGSRADLFEGARWYLTPTARSQGILFDRLHGILAGIGARPQALDAAEHDRQMAVISHLPHVLANVLVATAAESLDPEDSSGGGVAVGRSFRDATRVAGANPGIWADIFATNADAVVAEIDRTIAALEDARRLLTVADRDSLATWQQEISDRRRGMIEADLAVAPLIELRIAVENRPGTVAELALALGKESINIEDMSLDPSPDQRTGAISLWVGGVGEARRAAEIVAALGHTVAEIEEPT